MPFSRYRSLLLGLVFLTLAVGLWAMPSRQHVSEQALSRNRVVLDMVFNHTSDLHPWFKESSQSETSAKRNWYVWRKIANSWLGDHADGGRSPRE